MDNISWDDLTKPLCKYSSTNTWTDESSKFTGTINYKEGFVTGELVVKNLGKYTGEFSNNKFQGVGTLTYENGDQYIGSFDVGQKHGAGVLKILKAPLKHLKSPEAKPKTPKTAKAAAKAAAKAEKEKELEATRFDIYEGHWAHDVMEGNFNIAYASGDKFVGQYKANQKVSGLYTFKNGDEYQGGFKNEKFHGQGKYSGKEFKFEGLFENGKRVKGTECCDGLTATMQFEDENAVGKIVLVDEKGQKSVAELKK